MTVTTFRNFGSLNVNIERRTDKVIPIVIDVDDNGHGACSGITDEVCLGEPVWIPLP